MLSLAGPQRAGSSFLPASLQRKVSPLWPELSWPGVSPQSITANTWHLLASQPFWLHS